jgi:hypothetical protein
MLSDESSVDTTHRSLVAWQGRARRRNERIIHNAKISGCENSRVGDSAIQRRIEGAGVWPIESKLQQLQYIGTINLKTNVPARNFAIPSTALKSQMAFNVNIAVCSHGNRSPHFAGGHMPWYLAFAVACRDVAILTQRRQERPREVGVR